MVFYLIIIKVIQFCKPPFQQQNQRKKILKLGLIVGGIVVVEYRPVYLTDLIKL